MKLIAQIATFSGVIVSVLYIFKDGISIITLLSLFSFLGAFAGSFFLKTKPVSKMSQKTGDNSIAIQSGKNTIINNKNG